MKLTPTSVIPNAAPADKELVIVVCTDEDGNVHNHYIRDAALQTDLKAAHKAATDAHAAAINAASETLTTTRAAIDAPVLERAAREIALAAELKPEDT